MANKTHRVGIYARLSREDSRSGESVSIENQRLLLLKHVQEMGWELVEIYQDDGFSGTNQNRPALQRLLQDVKNGHINTVLIKEAYVKHILKNCSTFFEHFLYQHLLTYPPQIPTTSM